MGEPENLASTSLHCLILKEDEYRLAALSRGMSLPHSSFQTTVTATALTENNQSLQGLQHD
jgi:hypothetical protein